MFSGGLRGFEWPISVICAACANPNYAKFKDKYFEKIPCFQLLFNLHIFNIICMKFYKWLKTKELLSILFEKLE